MKIEKNEKHEKNTPHTEEVMKIKEYVKVIFRKEKSCQITIPKAIVEEAELKKGDAAVWEPYDPENGEYIVRFVEVA